MPHNFDGALKLIKKILSTNHELAKNGSIDSEAEQIFTAAYREITGKHLFRAELYLRAADRLPEKIAERLYIFARARAEGKLLQHLTGVQTFLDHEYTVGPEVLIPRPETEVLVTEAISRLKEIQVKPRLGLELGIGSGVISIELLAAFPEMKVLASELSPEARKRARENADRILSPSPEGSGRLQILPTPDILVGCEIFRQSCAQGEADFFISNPPYLAEKEEAVSEVVAQEPAMALFAPQGDPLFFYKDIVENAPYFLRSGGFLFCEIPHERAAQIDSLFKRSNLISESKIILDLNQRERVLVAKRS